MGLERCIILFLSVILQLLGITTAEINFIAHYCNFNYNANYTSNSLFQKNLDTLPSFIDSDASFYNFTIGESEKVNVIALCRRDVNPDICRSCLLDSNKKLRDLCPQEKESIGWSDNCMLRHSDRAIFKSVSTLPNAYAYNPNTAKNVTKFNTVLRNLLNNLSDKASQGNSIIKFATGNMSSGLDDVTIFGQVQCTPDLNLDQCKSCFDLSFKYLPECCDGRIGGRVLMPSCNFRYEIGRFYNETQEAPVSPLPQPIKSTPPPPANAPAPPLCPPSNGKGGKKQCICRHTISANSSDCDSHLVALKFQGAKELYVNINIQM